MKVGEIIKVKVVEEVDRDVFIVNVGGRLIRVQNSSARRFKPQDKVELKVIAIDPLAFQLRPRRGISLHA